MNIQKKRTGYLYGEEQGLDDKFLLLYFKNLYSLRSPAQAGCMRHVLGPGALGRPRGIGWRGWWEGDQDGEYL